MILVSYLPRRRRHMYFCLQFHYFFIIVSCSVLVKNRKQAPLLFEVHDFGGRDTRDDGGWREQNQQRNKQYASIEHE